MIVCVRSTHIKYMAHPKPAVIRHTANADNPRNPLPALLGDPARPVPGRGNAEVVGSLRKVVVNGAIRELVFRLLVETGVEVAVRVADDDADFVG